MTRRPGPRTSPLPTRPNRSPHARAHAVEQIGGRPRSRAIARRLRRASTISAWSRSRSPTRSVGMPDWRVPKKSPGPRSCRSRSAISKPSVVSVSAFSRASALIGQRILIQQDAVRLVRAAADAAAQLVQLRQPEALGVLDRPSPWRSARRRRPRSTVVETSTSNSPRDERAHDAVLRVRLHAAVQQRDADTPGTRPATGDPPSRVAALQIDLLGLFDRADRSM